MEDSAQGGLLSMGIVAMGLGQVTEPALITDDGDGGIGHGGEIAGQVADMSAAAVFVPGEVADVMESILDFPVTTDQSHQALGVGLCGGQRGQAVSHLAAGGAGLDVGALALDAEGLAAMGQVGIAVPLLAGQVEAAAAAGFDAPVGLVDGFGLGGHALGRVPVDGAEVLEQGWN